MSTARCPHCEVLFSVVAAQNQRCGACGGVLSSNVQTAPTPSTPTAIVPAEAVPRRTVPDEEVTDPRRSGDWSVVRGGLGLLAAGLGLSLICQVGGSILNVVLASLQMQEAVLAVQALAQLGEGAAAIILLVGLIQTVLAPRQSGLLGLGVAALLCSLGAAGVLGAVLFDLLPAHLVRVSGLLPFVAALLFFLYLNAVARTFGSWGLGMAFIAWFGTATVLGIALVGILLLLFELPQLPLFNRLQGLFGDRLVPLAGCLGLFAAWLGMSVWLIYLVNRLRALIPAQQ